MKVLHITNNYPTSQFPIYGIFVKEQIDSLNEVGIENEIFFINGREEGKTAYINGIKKLRKKLINNNYDILHCHHAFSALILILTFHFFKCKKIISYQNDPEREGGLILFHIIYSIFNGIIFKNNTKRVKLKKIYYLPNGVNTNFFKPEDKDSCKTQLNLDKDSNFVLFLDSNNRRTQKRIDRFNKTISLLQKNGNVYNIQPLVLTNTKRDLVPLYMNASALHLLTSDFEGSPNSIKECLACDIPVVSTPVGNVADLIGDIKGCYISKSFEPEELAKLVLLAIKCDDFKGRNNLLDKKLDIKSVAVKLHAIYNNLIKVSK